MAGLEQLSIVSSMRSRTFVPPRQEAAREVPGGRHRDAANAGISGGYGWRHSDGLFGAGTFCGSAAGRPIGSGVGVSAGPGGRAGAGLGSAGVGSG